MIIVFYTSVRIERYIHVVHTQRGSGGRDGGQGGGREGRERRAGKAGRASAGNGGKRETAAALADGNDVRATPGIGGTVDKGNGLHSTFLSARNTQI